jgi:hypothetical protein
MNSSQDPVSEDICYVEYVQESPYPSALYSLVFSFKTLEMAEIAFQKMSEWGLPLLIKENVIKIKFGNRDSNLNKAPGVHIDGKWGGFIGIYFNNMENANEFFTFMEPARLNTDQLIKMPDMLFFENHPSFDAHAIYFREEDLIQRYDFKKRVVRTEVLEKYIYQLFLLKYVCDASVDFPIELSQMIMCFNVMHNTVDYSSQINKLIRFNKQFPLELNSVSAEYKKKFDCYIEHSFSGFDDANMNRLHLIFSDEDEARRFFVEINADVQKSFSFEDNSNINLSFNEVELSNRLLRKGARLIALDNKTIGFLFETACEAEYIHNITRFNVYDKDNHSVVVEPVLNGSVIEFPLEKLRKRNAVFFVETDSEFNGEECPQAIKRINHAILSIIQDLRDGWKTKFFGVVQKLTFWVSNEEVEKSKKMLADIVACLNVLQAKVKKDLYIKSFAEIVSEWKQSGNVRNILNNEWAKSLSVSEKISEIENMHGKSSSLKQTG